MEKQFLTWLKENQFHQYKDGNWYSTKERPYIQGKTRKYYTDDELIAKYVEETIKPQYNAS